MNNRKCVCNGTLLPRCMGDYWLIGCNKCDYLENTDGVTVKLTSKIGDASWCDEVDDYY